MADSVLSRPTIPAQSSSSDTTRDTEEDTVTSPMIFSCNKCKTIVGDSFSYVEGHNDLKLIVLSSASNIQRSPEVHTSKEGPDIASTYFGFLCSSCQVVLGRYYLTTSADLDSLRGKFSFLVDEISSYQLGKSKIGKIQELVEESESVIESKIEQDLSVLRDFGGELLKVKCYFFYYFAFKRLTTPVPCRSNMLSWD